MKALLVDFEVHLTKASSNAWREYEQAKLNSIQVKTARVNLTRHILIG